MSDSNVSTASEGGIEFADCSSFKFESELDLETVEVEERKTSYCELKNEPQLMNGNECAIEMLLKKPFSSLSYQEKLNVVENDRPTEPLYGLLSRSRGRRVFTRHFNSKNYETVTWLCGCSRLRKLFCWPCLLFCPGNNVWNSTGYEDLNNFHTAVKRHKMSTNHITSLKKLKQFNKIKTDFCLIGQSQPSLAAHNKEVKKNRKMFSHIVNAFCFLTKHSLMKTVGECINEKNYCEFFSDMSECDIEFTEISYSALEQLIQSVYELAIDKIKDKLVKSPCIALILDDIVDLNDHFLSMSVRYLAKDGNIRETFLGFKQMGGNVKAKTLALHMLEFLHKFSCEGKLIAYSFDGGVLAPGEYEEFETQMKNTIPTARFENYYAHSLDVVVSQSVSFIKRCKVFFANLSSVELFFTKSKPALKAELKEKLLFHPSAWEFCSRLLETVHTHQERIVGFLTSIVENAEQWDCETVCSARGLQSIMEDFEFNLLLEIFRKIFGEIEKLSRLLEKSAPEASAFESKMEHFKGAIEQVKEDFESIWSKSKRVKSEPDEEQPRKRIRIETMPTENSKPSYRELLDEIAVAVLSSTQYRLGKLSGLKFMNLLDNKKFEKFKTKFPVSQFNALKSNYEKYFDFEALKGELTVVCLDKEMHKDNVLQLISYLVSADLVEIFPEVLKLGALILTIPTFCSSGTDASASRRVKAYVRNTQGQERSPALAMLSIEKALLSELRNSPTFTDDVIDIFAQKNPNISLVYKKEKLLEFLWRLRKPDGSFEMHEGGEVDMRGIYCAVSIAKLTNIYTDELFQNSAEWIASCQTYEGGFAGCPDMEAHGGYAFCGLAALVLLNKQCLLNIKSFLRWVVFRQMRFEGGFQGRTNKLVDGCYSFWQGGVFPIIHGILSQHDENKILSHDRWMFHQEALQEYILICCQNSSGGLIDKPKKPRDFYHTCYTLSGLSVAQHSGEKCVILGCKTNELSPINPLYNIELETVSAAIQYFQKQPLPVVKQSHCKV